MQVITDNRVGYLDSVDVAKDYVSLITEQCGFLQRSYIQSIDYGCRSKDKAFEIKQAIANYIINLNIDKNAQVEKCMDPLTAEFLEKEQVTNIYKYVLSNNIANADLLFFKRFLVIDKDNPRMLCKTLIDSYKKGNIKIENERDFNIFQDHLKYLSENHMKDLLPGMQKDLSDISKSFGIKGEIKQSTVSI